MAYGFKTGGREKGTPNKNTGPVSENLYNIFMDEFESGRVQEALQELEPKDYIAALLKWSPFVLAKARPANDDEQPHAADEPQTTGAQTAEEPEVDKGKMTIDEVQQNIRRHLVKKEEIENFRQHMDWTDEQVSRFISGETIDEVARGK